MKHLKKFSLMWILIISAPIFIWGMYHFRYFPALQFQLLTLAALIYVVLALIHHLRDKYLTLEVVIEYILIAALTLIVLQSVAY